MFIFDVNGIFGNFGIFAKNHSSVFKNKFQNTNLMRII